jgi:hypothetical protein
MCQLTSRMNDQYGRIIDQLRIMSIEFYNIVTVIADHMPIYENCSTFGCVKRLIFKDDRTNSIIDNI